MANPGRQFDKTHLSLDQAEARGFIHRDYLAHCLRWSHICKVAAKDYKAQRWLDIGCGKDLPLARLLYTSKLAPTAGYYLGVDLNQLPPHPAFANSGWKPLLLGGVDVLKALPVGTNGKIVVGVVEVDLPIKIVCLEMLEHVQPAYCRQVLEFIHKIVKLGGGEAFISTPCYDAHVGAAENHICELTYAALGGLLEDLGFAIAGHWGTFASQRDYLPHCTAAELEVFEQLKTYYDSNLLAVLLAPLHPAHARNCLWQLRAAEPGYQRQFRPLAEVPRPWTSSPHWQELAN